MGKNVGKLSESLGKCCSSSLSCYKPFSMLNFTNYPIRHGLMTHSNFCIESGPGLCSEKGHACFSLCHLSNPAWGVEFKVFNLWQIQICVVTKSMQDHPPIFALIKFDLSRDANQGNFQATLVVLHLLF